MFKFSLYCFLGGKFNIARRPLHARVIRCSRAVLFLSRRLLLSAVLPPSSISPANHVRLTFYSWHSVSYDWRVGNLRLCLILGRSFLSPVAISLLSFTDRFVYLKKINKNEKKSDVEYGCASRRIKKRSLLMKFNYSRVENWQVILIWVQM